MTLIFCESRQLAASRFISAGVTDLKSSHDAGPTFTGELSLRDSQTSPTIERQANESSPRVHCDGESLEGEPLLKSAVLATAILLASPTTVAAEPPIVSTHAVMPDLFAGKHEPVMTGEQSPYKGKFYRAKQRAYALCVLSRESNNHWYSTNRASGYFGGRQFSKALAVGATFMMTAELQATYGPRIGRAIARELRATEMHKWLPMWQDMAFWTVINWKRDGSGLKHFSGGRWRCAS